MSYAFESEVFEADFETDESEQNDETEFPYEAQDEGVYEDEEEEAAYVYEESEAPPPGRRPLRRVPVIRVLYVLYRSGRLDWKAGRFVDKLTGMVFAKTMAKAGADQLLNAFRRAARPEDAVNSLPEPLRRALSQLAD